MTAAIIIGLLLLALVPALIARHRGLGFWTFYVFGLILWIAAVPAALLLADKRVRCPYCREPVREAASVCPHCQRDYAAIAA